MLFNPIGEPPQRTELFRPPVSSSLGAEHVCTTSSRAAKTARWAIASKANAGSGMPCSPIATSLTPALWRRACVCRGRVL